MTYLETKLFSIKYNGNFLIIEILTYYGIYAKVRVLIYLSRSLMVGATALIKIDIISK
jgi:hypothetical protein